MKGSAGLDYLRNAFANKYGSPSDSNTSIPSTLRWISSVWNCKDQEWEEYVRCSAALASNSSQELLPSTTLRTGGNILLKTTGSPMSLSLDGANAKGSKLKNFDFYPSSGFNDVYFLLEANTCFDTYLYMLFDQVMNSQNAKENLLIWL